MLSVFFRPSLWATCVAVLGEYQTARDRNEDTLARWRRVLGDDHPDTRYGVGALDLVLEQLGRPPGPAVSRPHPAILILSGIIRLPDKIRNAEDGNRNRGKAVGLLSGKHVGKSVCRTTVLDPFSCTPIMATVGPDHGDR
ncbi:tetratricopeptide repeat protein [Frankia sp. R82]|uniref:tetratricopeptide repeat protein n=1 Tax=Frankia sp. R82 TaxID=2950553 RepID=UPI0035AB7C03